MIGLAFLVSAGLILAGALAYWHLITAEGAYLGPRVVAWTYDCVAGRYDSIKQFNPGDEDWFVAGPVLRGLAGVDRPLILDVATGTGRLPLALLRNHLAPHGQIVGLDLSQHMLRQARAKLAPYGGERVFLLWQDASRLPFEDGTFDAVTCLEALEFLPRPREALAEMVRVLVPGGLLLVTNRVGPGARLLPGRVISRAEFEPALAALALDSIETRRWQVDYDLIAAVKAGERQPAGHAGVDLPRLLRCPACDGRLLGRPAGLRCTGCERVFAVQDGVVALATTDRQGQRL